MHPPMIAVVGCGAWGKNLVRNFQALEQLAAVVDVDAAARAAARTLVPEARVFADVRAVLDDPAITAVALATPAATHAALCHAALDRGKDVFCEKPLALSYPDAQRVAERARDSGRILMVGHILEYHPAIQAIRAMVERGSLGRVRHLQASRLHRAGEGRDDSILWTLAPHDLAVTLRIAGALPTAVIAHGGAWLRQGAPGVASIELAFADGLSAHLYVSCVHHYKEQRLAVVGDRATATFDDVRDELRLHPGVRAPRDVGAATDGEPVPFAPAEPLRLECAAFLDAMRTRRAPLTDGRSAVDVLRVAAAAEASIRAEGRPVAP